MSSHSTSDEESSSSRSELPESPLLPPDRAAPTLVKKARRTFEPSTHLSDVVAQLAPASKLNQYVFTKLTPDGEIRLLVLHPGKREDKVECSLITVSLSNLKHRYEALSYHWGTDKPSNEIRIRTIKGKKRKGQPRLKDIVEQKLMAQSMKFHIRRNLYAALKALREEKRDLYLWTDALCINQKDKKEKTQQVSMMADIYNNASNVCIWLGEGNQQSDRAIDFIPKILDLSHFDTLVNDESSTHDWNALQDLMIRRWFSRRWVVQEVALARNATLHCGAKTVHWRDFADAVALFVTKLDNVKALFKSSREYSHDPETLMDVRALGSVILVEATSNLFRKTNDGHLLERLSSLETLVSTLLTFESTDPRDTIYALLSIAKDTVPRSHFSSLPGVGQAAIITPSSTVSTILKPDYTKDIVEVYTDFTNFCIQSSQSLDIICRHWAPTERNEPVPGKEHSKVTRKDSSPALKKPRKLPSWVPLLAESPYGAPEEALSGRKNGDSLVGHPSRKYYNAAAGLPARVRFGELLVDENSDDLNLYNSTSHPGIFIREETSMAIGHLDSEAHVPYLGTPSRTATEETVPSEELRQPHKKPNGSMFVYGFTLDTIAHLSGRIAEGLILKECLKMGGWEESDDGNTNQVPPELWRTLVANRGPDGGDPPSWYHRACLHCLAHRTNAGDVNTGVLIASDNKPSTMKRFLERVQRVIWNRKFLRSNEKKLFGLAPERAREKDMICILYGCTVPVVLREHRVGLDSYFEFIGECYIHGMMDGEAMTAKSEDFEFELR
ncbi:hypothetical protein MMC11_004644 [Xylographa trunciseda]|nr:hypothetical protein [Xylographa trunciseda]